MSDNDKIINLSQHKAKCESLFKIQSATRDVEKYEEVIYKSLREWDSYSVAQKSELFESVALFNIEILQELIERMKNDRTSL